ncbi:hypothetical protein CXF68_02565 [Tenacibaculum sp. Bg11-29]|uniref:DUF2911 domain-containing protein n=1 Tax=Tenacibaculum sp. Bg11-29 TaxID=2058306 RepID=UPI000C31EA84|nr:DUF2911 domain-containing protein [Tenacibaculum sp. Bg11-29]PKH49641.1 hypothetical protein CXF68_02565 [Tenacibaculum sp. Bg11-29]
MKTLYITIVLLFSYIIVYPQLKIPSLSSSSEVKQKVGLTEITIEYSRPSRRGRIIFGESGLLPNKEVWRTGANSATKIIFSKAVFIKGNVLGKGIYTILSFPNDKIWKMKWYRYTDSDWNFYKDKKPVFEIELPVIKMNSKVETFEIHFQDVTLNSTDIVLEWEQTKIKVPVRVKENEEILKSIDRVLYGPSSFDFYQAALYLHETKTNLNKALMYIQKVTKSKEALFFQVTREAMILKDLGKNKEAVKVAKRALLLSEKAKNNDFVRLNENVISALEK